MADIYVEIVFIVLLVLANGLLAMSEMAIVSVRKTRLQQRADRGERKARIALKLAEDPNQFLSTVQIGITLVGILAGAFGGATVARHLALRLQKYPELASYSEAIAVAVVVLTITYLSLILGELVPKRLALGHAEKIAVLVARPMQILSLVSSPAVRLLSLSTDGVLRLLRIKTPADELVGEEEIELMIRQGTEAGMFDRAEHDMVKNVFRFGDRDVKALMRPRHEIVWLDAGDAPEENRRKIIGSGYSRFPVCRGSLDNVLGIARARDLLVQLAAGEQLDFRPLLRPAVFVPESMRAVKALEMFKKSGTHLLLVVDEYGGTEGMVTHHDVLEAIVGDIVPSGGQVDMQAVRREDGSWLLDGMLPIDELKEILAIDVLPEEDSGLYNTLGGLLIRKIGHIPATGEYFDWRGFRFEVVDMDARRIDKVLVTPKDQDSTPA